MRVQLAKALDWGEAHVDFDKAVAELAPGLRGQRPAGLSHSPWQILEHLRIAQHDILDFAVNPNYEEKDKVVSLIAQAKKHSGVKPGTAAKSLPQ